MRTGRRLRNKSAAGLMTSAISVSSDAEEDDCCLPCSDTCNRNAQTKINWSLNSVKKSIGTSHDNM